MADVIYKKCPKCGAAMERDYSTVLTSIPPKYRYICPNCGEMEADTYPPTINILSPYDAVKQELTLEDLVKYREELDNWDWEKYRREAAKDLLPLATQMKDYRGFPEECVSLAIQLADELIKQLKK